MKKEEVRKWLMPELDYIKDEKTKDTILDIWQEAIDSNEWESKGLEHSGISTVMRKGCPEDLMMHTRHVTAACNAVYDALKPMFDQVGSCSKEELLAGAMLHDVGKLLEMDYVDGKVVHTHYGDLFNHTVSSAWLCKKHGLSQNIVHMVLTHSTTLSPEGTKAYCTPESLVLKYLDEMCYKYVELHWHI